MTRVHIFSTPYQSSLRWNHCNYKDIIIVIFSTLLTLLLKQASIIPAVRAQNFDPYQLNGGLVTAVAGNNYVLIASDTRLTDGGYGLLSRRYISGRIWSASSTLSFNPSTSSLLSSQTSNQPKSLQNAGPTVSCDTLNGSLVTPSDQSIGKLVGNPKIIAKSRISQSLPQYLPILIGSAGCASDCEALKRQVRLELDALECNYLSKKSLGVRSVANLLQQVLYGRRGFPFYSFCVVAGIDYGEQISGTGAVYVYDAIGSFERVAVGCAGTGRELLQPVLDRLFSETSKEFIEKHDKSDSRNLIQRDVMAIPAEDQKIGHDGSLRPPVKTTVNCSWEEAIDNLAVAYLSVSEREISIGDELVVCVLKTPDVDDVSSTIEVFNFQLKKH